MRVKHGDWSVMDIGCQSPNSATTTHGGKGPHLLVKFQNFLKTMALDDELYRESNCLL